MDPRKVWERSGTFSTSTRDPRGSRDRRGLTDTLATEVAVSPPSRGFGLSNHNPPPQVTLRDRTVPVLSTVGGLPPEGRCTRGLRTRSGGQEVRTAGLGRGLTKVPENSWDVSNVRLRTMTTSGTLSQGSWTPSPDSRRPLVPVVGALLLRLSRVGWGVSDTHRLVTEVPTGPGSGAWTLSGIHRFS